MASQPQGFHFNFEEGLLKAGVSTIKTLLSKSTSSSGPGMHLKFTLNPFSQLLGISVGFGVLF